MVHGLLPDDAAALELVVRLEADERIAGDHRLHAVRAICTLEPPV
jgi:hypothetical protein